MAHYPKPFFRAGRGWYVQVDGRQIKLAPGPRNAETEEAALNAYHKIMAAGPAPAPIRGPSIADLADSFLEWTQRNRAAATYSSYTAFMQGFLDWAARASLDAVDAIRPHHVTRWADTLPPSSAQRRKGIAAVQRCFNWGYAQGTVAAPLRVSKPAVKRRETPVTPDAYTTILAALKPSPFRSLVEFVWETGARPQEARAVEARHVQGDRIVFPKEEAKGKKRPRVIYLTSRAAEIVSDLVTKYPAGPIFRNRKGHPWNPYSVGCRFAKLAPKIGRRVCLYDFRHGFCQRKLLQGHGHLTVAALMGHADGTMVARVYSHLNQADEHLKAALGST